MASHANMFLPSCYSVDSMAYLKQNYNCAYCSKVIKCVYISRLSDLCLTVLYVLNPISAVLQIFLKVTILDFQEFEEENYRGVKSWNHAKYKNYSHTYLSSLPILAVVYRFV